MITYLASPYTHESEKVQNSRYMAACRICFLLLSKGKNPYSPICHWHPISELDYYIDYESVIRVDLEILAVSTHLFVLCLDGWKESAGVRREIDFAKDKGIKTTYHTLKDVLVGGMYDTGIGT